MAQVGLSVSGVGVLSVATAIAAELIMGWLTYGSWPNPASAYITGISVGILVRTPFVWPYILCSLISISSKYVLRLRERHLWNPSNFGISVLLFTAGEASVRILVDHCRTVVPDARSRLRFAPRRSRS